MTDEKLIAALREAAVLLCEKDNLMQGQGESPWKVTDTYYWMAADRIEALLKKLDPQHSAPGTSYQGG